LPKSQSADFGYLKDQSFPTEREKYIIFGRRLQSEEQSENQT
jgi:hypothetical protein